MKPGQLRIFLPLLLMGSKLSPTLCPGASTQNCVCAPHCHKTCQRQQRQINANIGGTTLKTADSSQQWCMHHRV
uniref:Putative secreted protein n=1 Tax=Ixodes ricinus TaxID=34613 RepID=A0A6B0U3G7_IXORI